MPRKPTQIPGLQSVQITAYHKSFLNALDDATGIELSEFETSFVESNIHRKTEFTEKQVNVIQGFMDKFPRVYPKMAHYQTEEEAIKYVRS